MRHIEKLTLSKGDKVILMKKGYGVSQEPGNVFTFAGWYDSSKAQEQNPFYRNHPHFSEFLNKMVYFQVQEFLDNGYLTHNLNIDDFELFNGNYKFYSLMTTDLVKKDLYKFASQFRNYDLSI